MLQNEAKRSLDPLKKADTSSAYLVRTWCNGNLLIVSLENTNVQYTVRSLNIAGNSFSLSSTRTLLSPQKTTITGFGASRQNCFL